MNQLDRYILTALFKPFGFFVLVFSAIIWLTQSLRVVDLIVANNQGAGAFLEFAGLLLPMVFVIVLPISIFAATLFALNRLYGESELVVMMAAGLSPLSLSRAVGIAGIIVAMLLYVFTLWLNPMSARAYRDKSNEIRSDFANSLVQEGRFSHPSTGITVYIREATRSGEMAGILIHDTRDADNSRTYSANRALLQRNAEDLNLVMFDGTIQAFKSEDDQIAVLNFQKYVFDLGAVSGPEKTSNRKPEEFFLPELFWPDPETLTATGRSADDFAAEGHDQLSSPLYALALPLLALVFIITGTFQRGGFARRIGLACVAGLLVRILGLAAKGAIADAPALWPVVYAIPIFVVIASLLALLRLNRRRKVKAEVQAA